MAAFFNDNDDKNDAKKMVVFSIAAASCILLLFLLVLYMNNESGTQKAAREERLNNKQTSEASDGDDKLKVGESNLVSSDLDFWELKGAGGKKAKDDTVTEDTDKAGDSSSSRTARPLEEQKKDKGDDDILSGKDPDFDDSGADEKYNDGKHIKAVDRNGSFSWYELIDSMPKSSLDHALYLSLENGRLSYSGGGCEAIQGIDISKYQGTVDFNKVKADGIRFVMMRIAARGYSSGVINIDDKFVEYASAANAAGIPIGVYFYSQAVTETEAIEEASFAVAAASNYNIRYPIACDIETVANDSCRTDKLSNAERTKCVKSFCDTVKTYGYTPMIYGKRDFLISKLDLESLSSYDFWIADEKLTGASLKHEYKGPVLEDESGNTLSREDPAEGSSSQRSDAKNSGGVREDGMSDGKLSWTDYPYKYTIWQYATKGQVNGIDGDVDLDLCFVNYAER